MSDDKKNEPRKLIFAPGCFDSFEGTQEELDELVAELQQLFDSGELEEKMVPVDLDELDEVYQAKIERAMSGLDNNDDGEVSIIMPSPRNLQ